MPRLSKVLLCGCPVPLAGVLESEKNILRESTERN